MVFPFAEHNAFFVYKEDYFVISGKTIKMVTVFYFLRGNRYEKGSHS